MPSYRPSRDITDRDLANIAAAEDSNDDDYNDNAPSRSPRKRHRKAGANPAPRRPRRARGYSGSDISDDDEDDELLEENWTDESDDSGPVETNHNGRPVRSAVKKEVKYEETSDESDDALLESDSSADKSPTKRSARSRKLGARSSAQSPKLSKIVKLKIRTEFPPIPRASAQRKTSINMRTTTTASGGRHLRSRSELEDADESLYELSTSGRHAVRSGSKEPEFLLQPSRAGKGLRYPGIDPIREIETFSSAYRDENGQLVIASSQPEDNVAQEPSGEDTMQDRDMTGIPQLLSDLPVAAAGREASPQSDDPLHPSPERPREVSRPEIEALSDLEPSAMGTQAETADDDDEDTDEGPVINRGRTTRASQKRKADSPPAEDPLPGRKRLRARGLAGGRGHSARRKEADETSDFEPTGEADEGDDMSESGSSNASPSKTTQNREDYDSSNGRRSTRLRQKAASRPASGSEDDMDYPHDEDELAAEVDDLKKSDSRRRRRSQQEELVFQTRGRRNAGRKNYDLLRNLPQIEEDDEPAIPSPSNKPRRGGGAWQHRTLLSTSGPFGGTGGRSLLGGPARAQDADSDSSDDEIMKQPRPVGVAPGMTPTTAMNPFNPFSAQPVGADPAAGTAGTPANLGRIKDKQALADADPLGINPNVNFDSVGGLQRHIDQLKEMIALPLLYPEIFMRFKITPPRGVLFHGPPGTGKTLLARALATSVSSEGKKVAFYMRKGADALSKWVGEAERQLRLLFEEARKTQPSIIFFDEIDGLAPVRSSKQEQIHASIVSTLLALMDGMDGRGQVIVIGATNRPDSIDPALRRPGRFDREFYFPLPDTEARREIIDIHTRDWNPKLDEQMKDDLAELTKGYGGADLRALCTEAALNAVQRRYPQIYKSKEKLIINPDNIVVQPRDFIVSIKKMTPSSERSSASNAAPLPEVVAPLLRRQLSEAREVVASVMPMQKRLTALEEAMYEDKSELPDMVRERMQQAFETSRIFRPRMLIHGRPGSGQQYIAAAILSQFQGHYVQSFELSVLLGDPSSTVEATMIRLFTELRTRKPSVIYIPNMFEWYVNLDETQRSTFLGLLRSVKPNDQILLFAASEDQPEVDAKKEYESMMRDLFGYSTRGRYLLGPPTREQRAAFFAPLKTYIRTKPIDFPDPTMRKKKRLEILPPAPMERPKTPPPPSKEELKAQKKRDRQTLNMLKIRLQPIMDQIRMRHKKFRTGVIEESAIRYLYDEADPRLVTSDQLPVSQADFRPYEVDQDAHGVPGLKDQGNGQFYYNLDTVTIEKRLSNGYYKRPKDFLADIKRLAKDAKAIGDEDRLLKANELLANVEVDVATIELNEPGLILECEKVYQRELQREKEAQAKEAAAAKQTDGMVPPASNSDPSGMSKTDETGQIQLGMGVPNSKDTLGKSLPPASPRENSASQSSGMTNGVHQSVEPVAGLSAANHPGTSVGGTGAVPKPAAQSDSTVPRPQTQEHRSACLGDDFPSFSTIPDDELRQSDPFMGEGAAKLQQGKEANPKPVSVDNSSNKTGPDLFVFNEIEGFPDTQSSEDTANSTQSSEPASTIPLPSSENSFHDDMRSRNPLAAILNPSPDLSSAAIGQNLLVPPEEHINKAMIQITDGTSGFTVEQLEQVNSLLMEVVWSTRGMWDRRRVLENLLRAFNETLKDMKSVGQSFGSVSWTEEQPGSPPDTTDARMILDD